MQTDTLLVAHSDLWREATEHPFLVSVRDGDLPRAAFEAWLVQDYQFVRRALRFQAAVLTQAPRSDHAVLANGLVGLVEELSWFEAAAQSRGLELNVPLLPSCRAYADFLSAMASEPYEVAITTLWTVEQAYYDAWLGTRPGAPAYRDFVEHWTTPAFAAYVAGLAAAVDRALGDAPPSLQRAADEAFTWTARYERAFWQMAFEGAQAVDR